MAHLNEKAMLVGLSICVYSASKKAKNVEQEAADTHGAQKERISARKALISKAALEKIADICTEARQYHYLHTLPWTDEGARILSSKLYLDYTTKMNQLKNQFSAAVTEFCDGWPGYVAEAQTALGSLFNVSDYPKPEQIANKFKFSVSVIPLPSGADFRVELGEAEQERVRQEIDQRAQEGIQTGMKDVYERLHTATHHMVNKLKVYEPADVQVIDGKRVTVKSAQGIFRDSLIENVREIVGLLPALNITNDANLEAIRVKLDEEIAGVSADDLREDDLVRENVAKTAEEVLAQMEGYIG